MCLHKKYEQIACGKIYRDSCVFGLDKLSYNFSSCHIIYIYLFHARYLHNDIFRYVTREISRYHRVVIATGPGVQVFWVFTTTFTLVEPTQPGYSSCYNISWGCGEPLVSFCQNYSSEDI